MKSLIVVFIGIMFFGQANAKYEGRLEQGTWIQSWNDTLRKSLKNSRLLTHEEDQIEKLCPGYGKDAAKRETFWMQLMVSLAWKESIHGPRNYIKFNGGVNQGLYQIDPRLRTAYKCEKVDMFDPLNNIRCGVRMADHLVSKQGFLVGSKGGMAAYWQPLRATTKENKKNRGFILAQTSGACKTGKITYNSTSKNLVGLHASMAETSLVINTIDDLGLSATDLEEVRESDLNLGAPTFTIESVTGSLGGK